MKTAQEMKELAIKSTNEVQEHLDEIEIIIELEATKGELRTVYSQCSRRNTAHAVAAELRKHGYKVNVPPSSYSPFLIEIHWG